MKDKKWLKEAVGELPWVDTVFQVDGVSYIDTAVSVMQVYDLIDQLDEPETLSEEWLDENKSSWMKMKVDGHYIPVEKLQNLLVPKQKEVDRAYKDGYEKGKEHAFYKGCLEGLADKESEPETVADVLADFYKSLERLKGVLSMEIVEVQLDEE